MGAMTLTLGAKVLKYLDAKKKDVADMVARESPTLALLPTKTDMGGEGRRVPVKIGRPVGGRSATFSTAQTNAGTASFERFVVTHVKNYGVVTIDRDAVLGSQGNERAVIELLDAQLDGILNAVKTDIASGVHRNGGGAIGVISAGSTVASATITLATIADIVNFEAGMVLNLASTDGTSGAIETGTVTVLSVDYDAGTVTATGNWTAGVATAATGQYIFPVGDFGLKMKGFDAWLPSSAPGATAFYGVARNSSPTRLGGIRVSESGTIIERLIRGAAQVHKHGGKPQLVVLNPIQWADLEISLENRKRVVDLPAMNGDIGIKAIELATPNGTMNVISDPYCPTTVAWMLDPESWCMDSIGELIQIVDEDLRGKMLRQASADGFEIRVASYHALWCNAPGHNARISLS